jgi:GTP pyrophosphokinase
MIRQFELVERVKSYDTGANEDALNRAYVFSMKAHGSQKRASGDPYFSHPLEVAGILTEMKLDSDSIVTGLLHDTVEDTVATLDEIEELFGTDVAHLVDGVTKLSQLEHQSADDRQAENFRKLLLATSQDIRVLLVKLADRLHNMRTLGYIKDDAKRAAIARETMEIYAPLAERIGMQRMKDELEDLAFAELYSDAHDSVVARLSFLREQGEDLVPRILDALRDVLDEAGIEVDVSGREKRSYSIWRKMERQNVEFEQLFDIMAVRIVVTSVEDCYRVLGVIHNRYPCVPGRFKDYISTPKRNGYRSLHTGIIGPEQRRIEIQIRTGDMHEVAELGVAAHWQYKQEAGHKEGPEYRWVRELVDILEHASGPDEFLEHTKMDLFQDQVFCFTPKGELIALPRGATPIDFAYEVHSEVGDACVGTKINSRIMPLRTLLKHGDQVEIVTSGPGAPSPAWEQFVVTGKARARIRRFIRSKERTEYARLGEAILHKTFLDDGYEASEPVLEGVLEQFGTPTVEELFAAVGEGLLSGGDVVRAVFPARAGGKRAAKGGKGAGGRSVPALRADAKKNGKGTRSSFPIPIRGLIPGMAVHYSGCCHPLPGDRIIGILTTGKGIAIHTIDCETLESFQETPERWIDVAWDLGPATDDEPHVGRLALVVTNERGSLANLSSVVAKNLGNINNLKITNRNEDFFEMSLDIEVKDLKHLNTIIAALRGVSAVSSVERAWQ